MMQPLLKSTSWADVEDEESLQGSPRPTPMPAPAVPAWKETSNSAIRTEPSANRDDDGFQHFNRRLPPQPFLRRDNSGSRQTSDDSRRLWEPARSSKQGQRGGDSATQSRKKRGGSKKNKASSNDSKKTPLLELFLKNIPSLVSDEEIKEVFTAADVSAKRIIRAEDDRVFAEFEDQSTMENALKNARFPRWGDKEVVISIASARDKQSVKKKNDKKGTVVSKEQAKERANDGPVVKKEQKQPKKPVTVDSKKGNIFALLDSDSESDDSEESDEDDKDNEDVDAEDDDEADSE